MENKDKIGLYLPHECGSIKPSNNKRYVKEYGKPLYERIITQFIFLNRKTQEQIIFDIKNSQIINNDAPTINNESKSMESSKKKKKIIISEKQSILIQESIDNKIKKLLTPPKKGNKKSIILSDNQIKKLNEHFLIQNNLKNNLNTLGLTYEDVLNTIKSYSNFVDLYPQDIHRNDIDNGVYDIEDFQFETKENLDSKLSEILSQFVELPDPTPISVTIAPEQTNKSALCKKDNIDWLNMLYDYITNEDEDAIIILDTSKLIDVEDSNTLTESTLLNEATVRQNNKLEQVEPPIPLDKMREYGTHYDSKKDKWVTTKLIEPVMWWRESKKNNDNSHSYYLLPKDIKLLNEQENLNIPEGSYRWSDHWSSLLIRNYKTKYYYGLNNKDKIEGIKILCDLISKRSNFNDYDVKQLLKNRGYKLDVRIQNVNNKDGKIGKDVDQLELNYQISDTRKFIESLINAEDSLIWGNPTTYVYLYNKKIITIFFKYLDMQMRCGYTTEDLTPRVK